VTFRPLKPGFEGQNVTDYPSRAGGRIGR
jgi:hypothetical protein